MFIDQYQFFLNNSSFSSVLTDYNYIAIYFVVSLALSIILVFASILIINQNPDVEKVSAYECGFDPFDDSRSKFDIRFYLVSILFIVFDLEISFLFPWTVYLSLQTYASVCAMIMFLFILTVGFVYEWMKGGLDWE